jgi:hypothetical protein
MRRITTSAAPLPVTTLTEDEEMLRISVAQFAREKVAPQVKSMDENGEMPKQLIADLFSQGLMGVEIGQQYGGAGMSFLASCIAVEEMAKVDASVVSMSGVAGHLFVRRTANPIVSICFTSPLFPCRPFASMCKIPWSITCSENGPAMISSNGCYRDLLKIQ